jgi:type IV pilus assembly protein PilE
MNKHVDSVRGFSLVELMVVMVIAAILTAIAIPSYQSQVRKTNRKDAMAALQGLAQAMERLYAQNNSYAGGGGSKASPSDSGAPWIFPSTSPVDGGTPKYNLTIESSTASTYKLRATPVAGNTQDGDGFIELESTGLRSWDKDNSGSFSSSEKTWNDH